jgi:hypothetical protein
MLVRVFHSATSAASQPDKRTLTGADLDALRRRHDPVAAVIVALELMHGNVALTHPTPDQTLLLLRGRVTGNLRKAAAKLANFSVI